MLFCQLWTQTFSAQPSEDTLVDLRIHTVSVLAPGPLPMLLCTVYKSSNVLIHVENLVFILSDIHFLISDSRSVYDLIFTLFILLTILDKFLLSLV